MEQFVDLHVHSSFSDGSASVKDIFEDALAKNIKYMSVTDHNCITANRQMQALTADSGLTYIPGTELDAMLNDINVHILSYGSGCLNSSFEKFALEIADIQEEKNRFLIKQMAKDYPAAISFSEYEAFTYNRSLGGWKALHYFVFRGLASSIKDGMKFYSQYDCSGIRFPEAEEVINAIHANGCIAVLAHPVNYWTDSRGDMIINNPIIESKIDGIECFYAYNSSEHTSASIAKCEQLGKQITAGADYHGLFGNSSIGDTKTPYSSVRIGKLLDACK